jgi:hypothetical protein
MRGNHRRRRLLAGGSYNIVLLGTKGFRIRCERPPTATRLYRIAEVERLEEANDPKNSPKRALQRAHMVDLFGSQNSKPREHPLRAPCANSSM